MNQSTEIKSFHDYIGFRDRIAASRSIEDITEKLEMLRGFGFDCKLERHCGFWLLHYQYPRLKLVVGHVLHA